MMATPGGVGALFHQGKVQENNDPGRMSAVSKPGINLRRPVGRDDPFSEHAADGFGKVGIGSTAADRAGSLKIL
jgi:hypothetical protein